MNEMKVSLSEQSLENLIEDMRLESKLLGSTIRDLDLLEERRKELTAKAFLKASEQGKLTETTKKAMAATSKEVLALNELISKLKGQEKESMWNLRIFNIQADLWRSLNSSKTLERKLYEHLS